MPINYTISDESELKEMVRAITGYEDSADELPSAELSTLISVAAMTIKNETGSDAWFEDRGLGQTLLFVTCIRAKERVENYSVSSWTIGDQTIDVRNAGDEEQAQFQHWSDMASDGLEAADNVSTGFAPKNSSSYIG